MRNGSLFRHGHAAVPWIRTDRARGSVQLPRGCVSARLWVAANRGAAQRLGAQCHAAHVHPPADGGADGNIQVTNVLNLGNTACCNLGMAIG